MRECLQNIVEEKYPIEKLIISKSLEVITNPKQIAHKVLADRIGERIQEINHLLVIEFIRILNQNKTTLQGDRIETPTFIKDNSIKIDYEFYITNQIMKPVQQVFALVLKKFSIYIKNDKI